MKYALFLNDNFCTVEYFEGPINVGDIILYGGTKKFKVIHKEIDLQANTYDLYLIPNE